MVFQVLVHVLAAEREDLGLVVIVLYVEVVEKPVVGKQLVWDRGLSPSLTWKRRSHSLEPNWMSKLLISNRCRSSA